MNLSFLFLDTPRMERNRNGKEQFFFTGKIIVLTQVSKRHKAKKKD